MPLDAEAADRVRRLWQALAEQAGADDAIRLGYVPHLTLAVLPGEAPISAVEEAMARAVGWCSPGLASFPEQRRWSGQRR
jgi:hypothetical protein